MQEQLACQLLLHIYLLPRLEFFDTQGCVNGRENYPPVRNTREIGARKCKSDHADAGVNLRADFCVSPTVRVAPIGKQ